MLWRSPRVPESADQHPGQPDAALTAEPFATAEQVVLCCFGVDQSTELSSAKLCMDLVEAGFPAAAARQIIRSSPLVHRSATGLLALRRLGVEVSEP
jgi:hypothetical protein